MTAHTKLPPMPAMNPEVRPELPSPAPTKEAKPAGPAAYWGDHLTVKFWLFCFGLMVLIQIVDALRNFVLSLMGQASAP